MVAVLHNHCSSAAERSTDRDDPLYARRSYSSHTSPAIVERGTPDNTLSVRAGRRAVADNRGVVTLLRLDADRPVGDLAGRPSPAPARCSAPRFSTSAGFSVLVRTARTRHPDHRRRDDGRLRRLRPCTSTSWTGR